MPTSGFWRPHELPLFHRYGEFDSAPAQSQKQSKFEKYPRHPASLKLTTYPLRRVATPPLLRNHSSFPADQRSPIEPLRVPCRFPSATILRCQRFVHRTPSKHPQRGIENPSPGFQSCLSRSCFPVMLCSSAPLACLVLVTLPVPACLS